MTCLRVLRAVYSYADLSGQGISDLHSPLDVGQADLVHSGWHPHRLVVLVDDSCSDALLEVRPWDTDGVKGVCVVRWSDGCAVNVRVSVSVMEE